MRYFGGPFALFILDSSDLYHVNVVTVVRQRVSTEIFLSDDFWKQREIKEKTAILRYPNLIIKFEEYKRQIRSVHEN